MLDLLVIGAGLTGLTAALAAAEAGLRTGVIAMGLGALHWNAGTIDVLGYLPGEDEPVMQPLVALERLPAGHPFRQVGQAATSAALDWLARRLELAGLPYAGVADGQNLRLPSPIGAARPAFLAPAAQLAGRLDDPAPLLLVGFQGVRDFFPTVVAHHLNRQGYAARPAYLPGDLLTQRREANPVQLAQGLEVPGRVEALGQALHGLVAPGERIGLPALLGLDRHVEVWSRLQELAGAPVFEIPTLPPSVPGIRLHRALVRLLAQRGVRVESNRTVVGFGSEPAAQGPRITWVETETPARPLRQRAGAYLLATGGILGGGIQTDLSGRVWETVFDLPLTVPQGRTSWVRGEFLDPRGHPIFEGGVPVDADFRPVRAGAPVYANLWAAGSILAHTDPIRTRSQQGIAVATAQAAVAALMAWHGQPAAPVTMA